MFGKSSQDSSSKVVNSKTSTVIAEDVTIKDGRLSGDGGRGGVTVSGVLFSDIDIEGVLIVSKNGSLTGSVKADSAYVYGTIEGNVSVKGKMYIYSKGTVTGDVLCASFMVEEGAAFKGHCSNTVAQTLKLLSVKGVVAEQEPASGAASDADSDASR